MALARRLSLIQKRNGCLRVKDCVACPAVRGSTCSQGSDSGADNCPRTPRMPHPARMSSMNRLPLALFFAPLLTPTAWALDDPRPVDVLGFKLYPTLLIGEHYDDNYRELPDSRASGSRITVLEPSLRLVAEDRNSAYRLSYAGSRNTYHDDDDASHTDHRVRLDGILE